MKLIVGLGNPGKKYEQTWHNIGFAVVEKLREDWHFPSLKKSWRFNALIAAGDINGEKIILAQPQTFMNNAGRAVKAIAKYYKIPTEDIIVIHDDLDLVLGKMRFASDSSAGGHNGIKSLIAELGDKKFVRLKIGIRTDKLEKIDAADYVLMKWDHKAEEMLGSNASAIYDYLTLGPAKAMNKWN